MNLEDTLRQVRRELDDPSALRWSDAELAAGVARALQSLSYSVLRVVPQDFTLQRDGREQVFHLAEPYLMLIGLYLVDPSTGRERSAYFYKAEVEGGLRLNFVYVTPRAGQICRMLLVKEQLLAGLNGAGQTTLPVCAEMTLITGAVAEAYLLRAAQLSESLNSTRPDIDRLRQAAASATAQFQTGLRALRNHTTLPLPFFDPAGWGFRDEVQAEEA